MDSFEKTSVQVQEESYGGETSQTFKSKTHSSGQYDNNLNRGTQMTNNRFIETENEESNRERFTNRQHEEYERVQLPGNVQIDPQANNYKEVDNDIIERQRIKKVDEAFAKKFTATYNHVHNAADQLQNYVRKKQYQYLIKANNNYERQFKNRQSTIGMRVLQLSPVKKVDPINIIEN